MNRKFCKIENNNLKIDRKEKKIVEGKGKNKNRIRDKIFILILFIIFFIHIISNIKHLSNIVFAQENNIWFKFFYESGVLRGYILFSVIYPSIGGVFGIRPKTKKGCILFQSTVSIALGLLFIDVENIKYFDFNIIVRFSYSLYIRLFNKTYFFASLTDRYFYFIDKDSPLLIGPGAFWFGFEWKI